MEGWKRKWGKPADYGNDKINYSGTAETQYLKSMLRRTEIHVPKHNTLKVSSCPNDDNFVQTFLSFSV